MENLKHIINNHESQISANLFDNIMAERQKKKRDAGIVFWGITAGLLAMLSFAGYLIVNNSSTPSDKITTPTFSQPIATDVNKPTAKLATKTTVAETNQPAEIDNHQTIASTKAKQKSVSEKPVISPVNQSITIITPMVQAQKSIFSPIIEKTQKPQTTQAIPLPTLLPIAFLASSTELINTLPNNDCYSFGGRSRNGNSQIFIDLLGSPDFVKSSLTAKSSEFQSYQEDRTDTENYEFSYSAQLGIGLETGVGIVIRSGVNYSVYESRFRKTDPEFTKVTIEQIFDNQGNLLRNDTVTTIGSLDIQHHNTHKYIGIPLTLGYTTSGRALDIGFNVGAQFNIQTTSEGRFIGPDSQTTDFTLSRTSVKPAYLSKIGVQGIANLTFAYEVTDHLDIILAPHIKFSPTITTSDYSLDEKLMTTGLWLGGRIRF